MKVSIASLKNGLSKYLKAVSKGAEVIITDHNQPRFKITRIEGVEPTATVKEYEAFMKTFKPITQQSGAQTSAEMIRKMRDE